MTFGSILWYDRNMHVQQYSHQLFGAPASFYPHLPNALLTKPLLLNGLRCSILNSFKWQPERWASHNSFCSCSTGSLRSFHQGLMRVLLVTAVLSCLLIWVHCVRASCFSHSCFSMFMLLISNLCSCQHLHDFLRKEAPKRFWSTILNPYEWNVICLILTGAGFI